MYYLWSLLVSIVLFSAIQLNEYNKLIDKKRYSPFTFANLGTFIIIYMIITIIMYMVTGKTDIKTSFMNMKGGSIDKIKSTSIDPNMLRKISDNVYTGFSPNMKSDI